MVDFLTTAERSERMAKIRSADTKPEVILRRALHARGLRFRLGGANLPGRPDIVFPRHRVALFVHGCFWHAHGCRISSTPKSNSAFWLAKFDRNKARDRQAIDEVEGLGWRAMVAWECEITTKRALEATAEVLVQAIRATPTLPDAGSDRL